MANWNVGSVGSVVLNMIDDVPATISGILPTLTNMEIQGIENYTGQTIGTVIIDKFQPAVLFMTAAATANAMVSQGADTSSIKLGDLDVKKGKGSSIETEALGWERKGEKEKNELGRSVNFYKARG